MDVKEALDPVQQHGQHGRRPLPFIDGVSKSNKADKTNKENEAVEERFRSSVAGTIRGPREMATGLKKTTGLRRESGQGATMSNNKLSASTAKSPGITVEKKITVQEQDPTTPRSFSQRAAQIDRTPTPLLVQGDHRLLRDIERAPPGDPPILRPRRRSLLSLTGSKRDANPSTNANSGALVNSGSANKRSSRLLSESIAAAAAGEYSELARKRSQYFEDIFSARDSGDNSPAKERVRSESLVLAEIRTNVHVGDEFTIITELSAHLASRYSRPLSSIVVTIQHGQCMCFGGSFDSAYVMSVTALPSQLQPTTNKRNAALIQKHMEEALGVPPMRGHLRFVPVPETNLAYAGNTTIGHLDELSRSASISGGGGALKEIAYDSHNSQFQNGGIYTGNSARIKNVPGDSTAVQAQAISSGLGSRKHKTARKLSVKGISSTFRSPTPSPDKENKTGKLVKTTEVPPEPTVTNAAQLASPAVPSSSTAPTAAALPVIPERSLSLKEGKRVQNRERVESAPKTKDRPQMIEADKSGSRVGIHEILARGPTPAPQPASVEPTANPVRQSNSNPGRKHSQRARRTKSFVATFFGRSVSASVTPAPKIDEE